MDIQLYVTDEELKAFPEDQTDPDNISSPDNIHLSTSDLPRPHTDLPRLPTSLPVSTTKTRCRHKAKRSRKHKTRANSKNPIVTHSVIQLNECLPPIQKKGSLIQMSAMAYLPDQSFSQSLSQPVVVKPVVGQPVVSQLAFGQPSADQPGDPIPPLLSFWLQPDLNALARTLTPQALQYVHIGIQISRTLSNEIIMASTPDGSVIDEINAGEDGPPSQGLSKR